MAYVDSLLRRLVMDVGVLERKIIEVQTPSNGRFFIIGSSCISESQRDKWITVMFFSIKDL
jgi:hypothetical protein